MWNILYGEPVVTIPLGAQSPISDMWEKCVGAAFVILLLLIVALILYPPLTALIAVGVFLVVLFVCGTVCLGLIDSAREALEYA
jgi:hypothetical protein